MMPLTIDWSDIALRLALTLLAGFLFGLNRSERGRPAGLRTTLLVCLAASISMIQVNLLLGTIGKPAGSFVVLDLMRLPLGILSGMGFIGAAAIIRHGGGVTGVTTAATLWLVTVIGLALGGGELALGTTGMVVGLLVLWSLRWFEVRIRQVRKASLLVTTEKSGPTPRMIQQRVLQARGYQITSVTLRFDSENKSRESKIGVSWRGRLDELELPDFVDDLVRVAGVRRVEWMPQQE